MKKQKDNQKIEREFLDAISFQNPEICSRLSVSNNFSGSPKIPSFSRYAVKKMKEWKLLNIVPDGQEINIEGVNPWNHEWVSLGEESIDVHHPNYPNQVHKMRLYKIDTDEKKIIFAAGEFSNCVWGFYVPTA